MAFQHYQQGARNYLHHRATGAQTKPASVQTGLRTSCGFSASAPARALLSFIFKNPPPSPHDQPRSRGPRRDARRTERERAHWPRQQAKAKRARAHPRDSRASTSASTRVESKRQCFGRDFLAPGSIGDLSEHTGKPCLGAQVDTPTHRCDSHVRRRPALVSAPPHVPVRPFVWGCGS